mmetsp:Transcript_25955/g.85453  ORF Transcript_25955/g.85453 Transcript_25955/m.85453 type:complete len:263 (+) Transcript_25955:3826-4614(+)
MAQAPSSVAGKHRKFEFDVLLVIVGKSENGLNLVDLYSHLAAVDGSSPPLACFRRRSMRDSRRCCDREHRQLLERRRRREEGQTVLLSESSQLLLDELSHVAIYLELVQDLHLEGFLRQLVLLVVVWLLVSLRKLLPQLLCLGKGCVLGKRLPFRPHLLTVSLIPEEVRWNKLALLRNFRLICSFFVIFLSIHFAEGAFLGIIRDIQIRIHLPLKVLRRDKVENQGKADAFFAHLLEIIQSLIHVNNFDSSPDIHLNSLFLL